jgi:hypothetical protein
MRRVAGAATPVDPVMGAVLPAVAAMSLDSVNIFNQNE